MIVRTINGEIQPGPGAGDAAAGGQHRQAVHRRGADARHRGRASTRSCARPGMLSASVAEGYPYADVEEMGMAFLAIADGDAAAARDAARWLAGRAWERRERAPGRRRPRRPRRSQYAVSRAERARSC